MGLEAGTTSVSSFLGSVTEVSKEGPLANSVISSMDEGAGMSPGQGLEAALGAAAVVAFMRPDSRLAPMIAKLPMEVDMGRVDPKLIGAAYKEQQEADAARAVMAVPTDPKTLREEAALANVEQGQANIAREAVVKASMGAKPLKM